MHILVDCWIESENRATDLFRQFSPFGEENMRGENMGGDDTSSVTNTMASVWMLSTKQNKSADKRTAQNLLPNAVIWMKTKTKTNDFILAMFWYLLIFY